MKSGAVSEADANAAITRTSELTGLVPNLLEKAEEKKKAIEGELPASLVQLTEQVEYGRQFKDALRPMNKVN